MKISTDSKRIFKNFFSLNLLQLSNFIFPLIILPYVVRIIGVENFGLVSFAQAFITYFILISDYGFNLSGTSEISLNRNDQTKISEIFSSILILKLFLGVICTVVIVIIVFSIEIFSTHSFLYLICTGILFGSILFPHWFFQGIEKMEFIPVINIIIRIIQLILIFILINEQDDYVMYMILISAAQLLIGVSGLIFSTIYFKIKLVIPSINTLAGYLKSGFSLFSAHVGINIFTNSSVFVLGILSGNYAVGIFSAADKIRQAFQSIILAFTMSTYPNAVSLIKEASTSFINFIKKTLSVSILIGFILSLLLFIFAENIIIILFGDEFVNSIEILKWFSIAPLAVSIGIIFNVCVLVPKGYDSSYTIIILISVVVHLILLLLLVPGLNTLGAAYAVVATEVIIALLSIFSVHIKRLLKSE